MHFVQVKIMPDGVIVSVEDTIMTDCVISSVQDKIMTDCVIILCSRQDPD